MSVLIGAGIALAASGCYTTEERAVRFERVESPARPTPPPTEHTEAEAVKPSATAGKPCDLDTDCSGRELCVGAGSKRTCQQRR